MGEDWEEENYAAVPRSEGPPRAFYPPQALHDSHHELHCNCHQYRDDVYRDGPLSLVGYAALVIGGLIGLVVHEGRRAYRAATRS